MAADHSSLLDQLTLGIAELGTSSAWQNYLSGQARFHTYSPKNVMLIALQRPDATRVAGFHAWTQLGRSVKRGEKAIYIVAPLVYRDKDQDTDPEIRGFRWVPVFDLSQTEGDELPVAAHKLIGTDPTQWFDRLRVVANTHGFQVSHQGLPSEINGLCRHSTREILISPANSALHQVKTLAHELAHAILHEGETDRPRAELEAESVAFVVCGALGIDASGYSLGYVTSWAGGSEAAIGAIRQAAGRIQRCAKMVIDGVTESSDSEVAPSCEAAG
ncbi:MAG: ArdC-like ssDNA-binding domain-containing protein [Actinobacteria bacterium]|nr:ArdC-like ssDNA-binding domain-containing protein [Actinomycetota bacterium]